jgi:hypothetical protein
MYQREALWLGFDAAAWKPNAVQGIGRINALGRGVDEGLRASPRTHRLSSTALAGRDQHRERVRPAVRRNAPGSGVTVEGQLTGKEEFGGIQIRVYEPRSENLTTTPGRRFRGVVPAVDGVVPPMGLRQAA